MTAVASPVRTERMPRPAPSRTAWLRERGMGASVLVATISILQAAAGRWFALFLAPPPPPGVAGPFIPPPVLVSVMPGLAVDVLIVAAMIHDRRTIGRVHPAYWVAGGTVLAVQLLRVPVSATAAWAHVTYWLVALSP